MGLYSGGLTVGRSLRLRFVFFFWFLFCFVFVSVFVFAFVCFVLFCFVFVFVFVLVFVLFLFLFLFLFCFVLFFIYLFFFFWGGVAYFGVAYVSRRISGCRFSAPGEIRAENRMLSKENFWEHFNGSLLLSKVRVILVIDVSPPNCKL